MEQYQTYGGIALIAFGLLWGIYANRGYLTAQGKRLASLVPGRKASTAKISDEADLRAIRQLCPRYRNDPEGAAAMKVLKARFLISQASE
jgi:hypothetical protein